MDEQERKQIWMQELQDAAKGKDKIIADYAQQAVQCCNDGIPWAGVFNYGWMRMAEGMKHQQEISANELYFLICGVLFEPEKQEHKEEIRQHFKLITDNEVKKNLDRFINGLEIVGKALQAGQRIGAIKDAELEKMQNEVSKRRKHKHKKGSIKKAYEHFKSLRKEDTPHFNTFNKWVQGINVPKGFPGIEDEIRFLSWVRDEWDGPERKRAGRHIGNMSEEEISRKRKK